jgi:uncharacterized SAM-binding protein YcdF (DUF218 family)
MIAAVLGLQAVWLVANEVWREQAPWTLLAFLLVPWMLLAASFRRVLSGRGATLRLVAVLALVDVAIDVVSPYPQRFAFLSWEIVKAGAIVLGAQLAPRFDLRPLRVVSLAVAIVIPLAMTYVGIQGTKDETRPADAALVLGFALDARGAARPQLVGRIEHAVRLQQRGMVPRLVLSGGVEKAGHTEAAVMRDFALARGVPPEALILDESARSTIENFACSVPLFEKLGAHRILVVTEPWHMPRAMLLARRHGVDAFASPATSSVWQSPRHAAYWLFRDACVFVFESVRSPWASPGKCAARECEGCRRF